MKNITGLRQGNGLNRSIFSVFVVAALFSGFFVANNVSAAVIDIGPTDSIQAAIDSATDGDTINLSDGTYELSVQLNIAKPLSITGVGTVTLKAINPSWSTVNGSKHLLGIYAGTEIAPVTISNIIIDSDSKSHAVNTYGNAYGILNDVTIKNGKGVGLTVNGSTIIATNLNTNGNAWGAVNVDPGSGVTTPSIFTLNSGNLSENTQIWSDGAHVSEVAIVTVTATGYNAYSYGGTTILRWADRALTDVATIANAPTVLYTSIQAAINAATSGDTINVAAGTYTESPLIEKQLTLAGVGETKPVIAGLAPATYIVKINNTNANGTVIDNVEINSNTTGTGSNGFDYGILVNNSGNSLNPIEIKNSTVKNIWKVSGNGVEIENDSYVLIHHNTVSSFHKRGIRFINSEGKVYNNDVKGDSVDGTTRVQNLVNLWGGSTVEIYNNTLHDAKSLGTPTWDSPGIFISSYGGDGASVANIHDNEIYNGDTGIVIGSVYADTDTSSAEVTNNNLHDLNWAINFEKSSVTAVIHGNSFVTVNKAVNSEADSGVFTMDSVIDAKNNYWGAASGPSGVGAGAGSSVVSNVDYRPWLLEADGDTYALTIALTEPNQWALVSAPTLLSEAPTIVDDAGGPISLLAYENGAWFYPAGNIDNSLNDAFKPVSAFYAITTNKGGIGFKYAIISNPTQTSKQLTTGWNLVGTNTNSSAQNEFATIQNTPTDSGMVTLYVPGISNSRKDWGYTPWESDANHDLNANPITELVNNNLSEYDGYWVFMNAVKAFVKNL